VLGTAAYLAPEQAVGEHQQEEEEGEGAPGAAAVVATSNSGNAVQLRQVVYNDVNQTVDAMKQLVNDNTK
jgi:hypothetical protein